MPPVTHHSYIIFAGKIPSPRSNHLTSCLPFQQGKGHKASYAHIERKAVGKIRPLQVKRHTLPIPRASPDSSFSTFLTPFHQAGQSRHWLIASHTSAKGASIRHSVINLNSAIITLLIKKSRRKYWINLIVRYLHQFNQTAI